MCHVTGKALIVVGSKVEQCMHSILDYLGTIITQLLATRPNVTPGFVTHCVYFEIVIAGVLGLDAIPTSDLNCLGDEVVVKRRVYTQSPLFLEGEACIRVRAVQATSDYGDERDC